MVLGGYYLHSNKMNFKISRSDWVFLGILGLLIFTPAGTFIKVQANRLLAFSPSAIEESKRETLVDYRWNLVDSEGNMVNFETFRNKPTLVNFWATWCPPCIAEMPDLNKLYNAYKDRVNFVFVSDENPEITSAFINKYQYDFQNFRPTAQAPQLLQSSALPTTYLLSAEGEIVIKKTGAADWNHQKVKELLDQLIAKE